MSVAETIIKKCGGVHKTATLAGTTVNWVYRWRLSREKGGTGGRVPQKAQEALLGAAARGECDIRAADFFDVPEGAEQQAEAE